MNIYKDIAIVLSGHDNACCRSNSLRNFLLIIKSNNFINSQNITNFKVTLFVHPSEFTFIYKLVCKIFFTNFKVVNRCKSLEKYKIIFGCFSSVFVGLKNKSLHIYDPTLKDEYIHKNFPLAKVLK